MASQCFSFSFMNENECHKTLLAIYIIFMYVPDHVLYHFKIRLSFFFELYKLFIIYVMYLSALYVVKFFF